MSDTRQLDRPVIRLSCPDTGAGGVPLLCQAMIQALAQAAGGGVIVRSVGPGDERPTRPGDLGVALQTGQGPADATAHLVWYPHGGGARTGPDHPLPASSTAYAAFAQTLARTGAGLLETPGHPDKP